MGGGGYEAKVGVGRAAGAVLRAGGKYAFFTTKFLYWILYNLL
jgi:hypothetical protein